MKLEVIRLNFDVAYLDGDGRYLDADPPLVWSRTKNVIWKTSLPPWSNSSPVLLADGKLLFVCSEPDEIVAEDLENGKIVWKRSTRDVTRDRIRTHKANGWTSPTTVSDGHNIFTVFGSGVVASHTIHGKRVWAREVQNCVLFRESIGLATIATHDCDELTTLRLPQCGNKGTFGDPRRADDAPSDFFVHSEIPLFHP